MIGKKGHQHCLTKCCRSWVSKPSCIEPIQVEGLFIRDPILAVVCSKSPLIVFKDPFQECGFEPFRPSSSKFGVVLQGGLCAWCPTWFSRNNPTPSLQWVFSCKRTYENTLNWLVFMILSKSKKYFSNLVGILAWKELTNFKNGQDARLSRKYRNALAQCAMESLFIINSIQTHWRGPKADIRFS